MDAVVLLRLALRTLTDRLLVLAVLLMSCFLASWVMYIPSWERVSVLGIFCVFGYLVLPGKGSNAEKREETAE